MTRRIGSQLLFFLSLMIGIARGQDHVTSLAQSLSLPADAAAPADHLNLLPGFRAELVYSVPSEKQGSWVSMTVDPFGRLITSDQYGRLYRVTPPAVSGKTVAVEPISVDVGGAHGLLYAFDSLYVMANGKNSGLYRVRDTNGDDSFDSVELLRAIKGAGEHGPHAIVPAPDGRSLYVCAGNHTDLPSIAKSAVPLHWQEDFLLPRMWDARGHARGKLAPGGWICRIDPDGKEFELVSIGYRNEYDIAFNTEGELFTYDADMEWDVGTSWYRPTRVNHVTSGSEFGWRSGTGKWPEYYTDSLGSVVDIGPGSPTGIVFGTGANFPAKYQQALFISDWSYGVIYAVHMTPQGASYVGQAERFVSAAPLPATDLVINPIDGALYFTVGGRRTQSGLYRITYDGSESTLPALPRVDGHQDRHLRRRLETLHHQVERTSEAVNEAWPYLSHPDRAIRYAARVAVEHQPVGLWSQRALEEPDHVARIQALIALARVGGDSKGDRILGSLIQIPWDSLDVRAKLDLCRAMSLFYIRIADQEKDDPATRNAAIAYLNDDFPTDDLDLNRELAQLLIYLRAPDVIPRTLNLLNDAPTQQDQIHYALSLRSLHDGWTIAQRREYFDWFNRVAGARGGASFGGFLKNIRNEAIEGLTEQEKRQLAETLAEQPEPKPVQTVQRTKLVKKWTVDELLTYLEEGSTKRDTERGRKVFAEAGCYKCHRIAGEGGSFGHDLTGVGRRFNNRDLLESILEPSKVVSDQYQQTVFVLSDGRTVLGRVVNLSGEKMMVMTNMLEPDKLTNVSRANVEQVKPSSTSMMPAGQLDTFHKDEILDLLAYLRQGTEE